MFPFVAGQVLALVLLTSYNVYQFAEYSFRELSYVTPLSVPPRNLCVCGPLEKIYFLQYYLTAQLDSIYSTAK